MGDLTQGDPFALSDAESLSSDSLNCEPLHAGFVCEQVAPQTGGAALPQPPVESRTQLVEAQDLAEAQAADRY